MKNRELIQFSFEKKVEWPILALQTIFITNLLLFSQKQGEIFNKSFHINGRLMPSPSIKCTKSMGDLHKLNYNVVSKLKKFPSNFEGTSSSCFMKEINSFENLQSELDEDDLSLFKTAVFKIETPKSAVKTSLKTNMQSKPSNLFKYSIDNSQGINNILDFENNNKTLQKEEKVVANPLKRKNTTGKSKKDFFKQTYLFLYQKRTSTLLFC